MIAALTIEIACGNRHYYAVVSHVRATCHLATDYFLFLFNRSTSEVLPDYTWSPKVRFWEFLEKEFLTAGCRLCRSVNSVKSTESDHLISCLTTRPSSLR